MLKFWDAKVFAPSSYAWGSVAFRQETQVPGPLGNRPYLAMLFEALREEDWIAEHLVPELILLLADGE